MCAAAMLGRCWSSQSGKIDSDRACANRPTSNVPSSSDAPQDRRDQLADVDRRDPGPHADPEPRRVQRGGIQAGVLDGHRRGPHREPHRTAHQLQVLLVLAQVGQDVEIPDLARDLDVQSGGVEAPDVVHSRTGPRRSRRRTRDGQSRWAQQRRFRLRPRGALVPPRSIVARSQVLCGPFPGLRSCPSVTVDSDLDNGLLVPDGLPRPDPRRSPPSPSACADDRYLSFSARFLYLFTVRRHNSRSDSR